MTITKLRTAPVHDTHSASTAVRDIEKVINDLIVESAQPNEWSSIVNTPTTIAGYGITDVNAYAPALDGTGAIGTWPISILGSATTVTDAAQPNITSVGVLTSLTVSGGVANDVVALIENTDPTGFGLAARAPIDDGTHYAFAVKSRATGTDVITMYGTGAFAAAGTVQAGSGLINVQSGFTTVLASDATGTYLDAAGATNSFRLYTNSVARLTVDATAVNAEGGIVSLPPLPSRVAHAATSQVLTYRTVTTAHFGMSIGNYDGLVNPGTVLSGYGGLYFLTQGLGRLVINQAGDVGIGLEPVGSNRVLAVGSTARATTYIRAVSQTAGVAWFEALASGGISALFGVNNSGATVQAIPSGSTGIVYGGDFVLASVAGFERLRLTNAGVLSSITGLTVNGDITTTGAGHRIITQASTGGSPGGAGFRLTPGSLPLTFSNGDMWCDNSGVYIRINGVTKTFTLT